MTESIWKKGSVIESGNYPKNNFVGTLKAIYPTFNENLQAHVLQCDFEEGQTYNMPLYSKDGQWGLHADGSVDGFRAIGKFCNSVEKIDSITGDINMNNNDKSIVRLKCAWAFVDGTPSGFKIYSENQDVETAENIAIGCKIHNVATLPQVGDESQTSKWPDWTWSKIEGLQATKPANKPASTPKPAAQAKGTAKPPQAPPAAPQADEDLSDLLLEVLDEPKSPGELFTVFDKKYKVKEIRLAITSLGAAIKQIGEKPSEKYQKA